MTFWLRKKWLHKKAMINFKIYDITDNYNISRRESNQAIKFGQLIKDGVNFSSKFMWKKKRGMEISFRPLFVFLKKLYIRWKQVVCTLVLIYFGRPRLGHTIKTNFILQTVDPEICSILILYKGVWDQLLFHILCMILQENISHVIFY